MSTVEKFCVICKKKRGKLKSFNNESLDKCKNILSVRQTNNLSLKDVNLPSEINDFQLYHTECYRGFTALPPKYRKQDQSTDAEAVATPSNVQSSQPSTSQVLPSEDMEENMQIETQTEQNLSTEKLSNLEIRETVEAEPIPKSPSNVNTEETTISMDIGKEVVSPSKRTDSTYVRTCIFCTKDRKMHLGKCLKLQTCTTAKGIDDLIDIARKLQDESMIDNLNDIKEGRGFFLYHNVCYVAYRNKVRPIEKSAEEQTEWHLQRNHHTIAFDMVMQYVNDNIISNKNHCALSHFLFIYKTSLQDQGLETSECYIRPSRLKDKLLDNYRGQIKIVLLNDKEIVQPFDVTLYITDVECSDKRDILAQAAAIIRSEINNVKVRKLPDDIHATDLIRGECEVPEILTSFFEKIFEPKNTRRKCAQKKKISESLAQDLIFNTTNGRIKTSKHICLALFLKSFTNSKRAVNVINKYGHCISYSVLEGLETEATYTSLKRSTVCPEDIIRSCSLGTGVAFDNFDRFVDTQSGKDTLHDTVGIIYQDLPSATNTQMDGEDRAEQATSESIDCYRTSSESRKRRRRTFDGITFDLEPYLKKTRLRELLQSHSINLSDPEATAFQHVRYSWLLSHHLKIPKTPMWIGYNSLIFADTSIEQKVSYLTTINDSPTNVAVVLQTMKQSQRIAEECNQTFIEVTYDLAVAKTAFQIQSCEKPRFNNLFIHLGSFHIYLSYLKAVGKFIDDSGITNILVNADVLANGSVNGFISGKNYNRCKRIHPRLSLALQLLHFQKFINNKNININEEMKESLLNFNETTATTSNINDKDLLELFDSYDIYTKETLAGQYGLTAQYYMLYVKLVNYYLMLDFSIRTANFEMFKWVLPRISNIFFTFNHQNYSRYTVLYLDKLLKVNETHPGLIQKLEQGSFGVKRTKKNFSRIPIDLTMEQTSNADAANKLTGISFITNSYPARQRWALSHSLRCTIINAILQETGLKKSQDVTSDLKSSLMKKHLQSVQDIIENIKQNINPFAPDLDKNLLFNISSGRAVEDRIAQFLLKVENIGNEQREKFVKECSDDENRFEQTLKKNTILNFSIAVPKKKVAVAGKLVEVRMERDLFGQLLRLALEKKLDIEKILSHPLTPISLAFCHVGGDFCKTNKSAMLKIFNKETEHTEPENYDVIIYDAFFILNSMKDVPNNFGNIAKKLLQIIIATTASTIIIVFDKYNNPSIKDQEHELRGTSRLQNFQIRGPDQVRPSEFSKEMKNINFKEALINFFGTYWKSNDMAPYLGNKTLYFSAEECYCYSVINGHMVQTTVESWSCPAHEEADTKIIFHICQLAENTKVVVRCSDTDIPIIMLGNMQNINNNVQVWMKMGRGNKIKFYDINALYNALGIQLSLALPAFHAFTGCDYNPAFFKKGKTRPFTLLRKNENYIEAFNRMNGFSNDLDELVSMIENYVCGMYGFKTIKTVNEARVASYFKVYKMSKDGNEFRLPEKNFDASLLPPSQSELIQHILRTIYISTIWSNAHKQVPSSLDYLEHGWQLEEGKLVCKWFDGDQLPQNVEMITQDAEKNTDEDEQVDNDLAPVQLEESDESDEDDNISDEE